MRMIVYTSGTTVQPALETTPGITSRRSPALPRLSCSGSHACTPPRGDLDSINGCHHSDRSAQSMLAQRKKLQSQCVRNFGALVACMLLLDKHNVGAELNDLPNTALCPKTWDVWFASSLSKSPRLRMLLRGGSNPAMVHSEFTNSSDSRNPNNCDWSGSGKRGHKRPLSAFRLGDAQTTEEDARKRLDQAQNGWQAAYLAHAVCNHANQTQLTQADAVLVLESIRVAKAELELAKVRKDPVAEWETMVELAKVRKDPVAEWEARVELAKVRKDPVAEWEARVELAKVRKDPNAEVKANLGLRAALNSRSGGQTTSEERSPSPPQIRVDLLQSPQNQGSASVFAKPTWKSLKGFPYLPRTVQFDPTPGGRVFESVVPSAWCDSVEIPVIGDGPQLQALAETKHIKPRFHEFMTRWGVSGETDLATRFGFGAGSVDGCILCEDRKGGLLEIKGGESSLAGGKREASVYGSTVAMDHLASGVDVKDILVPIVVFNGQSMQFCATFMLEPSLPVFMSVSKQFDLDNLEDNRVAGRFWRNFIQVCNRSAPTTCRPQHKLSMQLNCTKYWIKPLSEEALAHGLGMFAGDGDYEYRVAAGLEHMILPLNALYRHVTARNVTVFPLCVMSPGAQRLDGVERDDVLLVYPDMTLEGFAIGIPDHDDTDTFDMYISALENAVAAVHEAGVVHLDLYVSNIMHRVKDCQVEIKIIDWDSAHLIGQAFNDRVRQALEDTHINRPAIIDGVEQDLAYVAALKKAGTADIWRDLRAGNAKQKMDAAFFNLMIQRE